MYQSVSTERRKFPFGAILITLALLGGLVLGGYQISQRLPAEAPAPDLSNSAVVKEEPRITKPVPDIKVEIPAAQLSEVEIPQPAVEPQHETPESVDQETQSGTNVKTTPKLTWPQSLNEVQPFLSKLKINGYSSSRVLINGETYLWGDYLDPQRNIRVTRKANRIYLEAFGESFRLSF